MEKVPWFEIGIWLLAWSALLGVHLAQKRGWFLNRWVYRVVLVVCLGLLLWFALYYVVPGLTGHTNPH